MRFAVQVETRPREGIADPEGATIERSLATLGFDGFAGVRVGKSMRFTVDAPTEDDARRRVSDVCARFLTNPVIEDHTVTLSPAQEVAS